MFKHILLPTDGSELSKKAIEQGVRLAQSVGAKVTGIYVMEPYHFFSYKPDQLEDDEEDYTRHMQKHAGEYLSVILEAAHAAGVPCEVTAASNDHPYEEIIKTAEVRGCDLIMLASHGRKGMQAMLLGGETNKVLTHTKIPVLVYRDRD